VVRPWGAGSQEESTGGPAAADRERTLGGGAAAKGAGAAGVAREPAIEIEQRHRLLVALDVGDAGHRTVVRPAAIVAILAGEGRIAAGERVHKVEAERLAILVDAAKIERRHATV